MGQTMIRPKDVEDFPVGSVVVTPTGRTGVVIAHKGYESRRDPFMRVMIKLDGGGRQDIVQLQPQFLKHYAPGMPRIDCSGQIILEVSA